MSRRKSEKPLKLEYCIICNLSMTFSTTTFVCKHRFHKRCINKWIHYGNSKCPLCRGTITSKVY